LVSALDPAAHLVAATTLIASALVVCTIPALRAAKVNPALALRTE
jgi:ABC-type lipoprotein release transport system permease subunit